MESQVNTKHTIDVKTLFIKTTAEYRDFCNSINQVVLNLPTFTPQEITSECNSLENQQNRLSSLDQQILDVVKLAGIEIQSEQFLLDYKMAFDSAITASNLLYDQLDSLKKALSAAQPVPTLQH